MKNYTNILKTLFVFIISTTYVSAQFPEGFETTVPPAGWTTFAGANGLGTAQNWQVSNISNSGAQSAYCRYENVSGGLAQDWLVTPQFTPTLTSNILTFMQRQSYTTDYGSVYKVFISTVSQTNHADFTLVDTQSETDFTYYYTAKEIDLSAYVGVPIYVAFVLEQDDGDNWLIDDVALTSIAPPCTNTGTDIVTACDNYTWIDGINYTASNNSATYVLINAAGCDSTVTLDLTIVNSNTGTDVITACDSYTWIDGIAYTASNNSATHILTNAAGCDSTVTLDLTITNSSAGTDVITACDSYTWIDGIAYTASNNSATHILTNAAGCDSTVTLDLTITNSNIGTDVITACDNYTWIDGVTYTVSNNSATHVLTNAAGCDSTVTLDLTIANPNTGTDVITACDSYTWIDGIAYTASNNSATHILTNAAGCDSTVTLDLTITNSSAGTDVITACDSYTWIDGIAYTASNNSATHILTNAAGCDSTVTLDLTITNSSAGTDVIAACDNYTWIDGVTYTVSNNSATHVLTNAAGCDSTVTLDLTIANPNTGTDVITACDSYTWIDGIAYTASNNTATQILTNAAGCDSTVTLDLTITNSNTGTDVITACDSYTWIDGIEYTASNNSATHILTNAAGCDSIVTLDLTINTVDNGITQLDDITLQSDASSAQYQWVDCSNNYQPINGETDQVFIAYANGDYALIVTENNCADTSDCVTINAVGLNNILTDVILNVFPNPTSNSFTISSDILLNSDFKIVDSQGREVLKGSIYGKEKTVNISKLSKGVYLVVFDQQNLPVLPVLKN